MADGLDAATQGAERRLRNPPLHRITDLRNQLEYAAVDSLIASGLHQFLEGAQATLGSVSLSLSEAFFWSGSHAA